MRNLVTTVGEVVGIGVVCVGLWLVSVPLAVIFLGLAVVFLSVWNAR